MTTETNRREFEEWAMSQDVSMFTFKNRKGKYADPITQTAWEAWQAAREQFTEQIDGLRSGINYASDQLHKVTDQRDELLRYNEAFRKETLICADCDAISKEEYDQAIEQRDRLADLVKQFVSILDITEESDSGRLFHPTNITSCRAGDLQKIGELVEALRKASKNNQPERTMKTEEQRIAIAEACRWLVNDDGVTGISPINVEQGLTNPKICSWKLPDYLNDLNAMHEAEKWLIEDDQHAYGCYCIDLQEEYGNTVHLTAAQRAEAFLKTIGKWK